ncbi:ISKra4 family transposase [Acaryochloris marina S15]|nr:ISKra4 family transposase [Acaryochloris marina S15]
MRISANVSYAQAAKDVTYLTGIQVAAKTQQRLVHQQRFPTPQAHEALTEVSVDGGKVRIRTPAGQPCQWKDYKTLATDVGLIADYHNNARLIGWTHQQPLASPVTCLGDGHDGIWNIIRQLSIPEQRREILDWYHLVENLHKVGGSLKRLHQAEQLLWQGKVDETLTLFESLKKKQAQVFCNYIRKHRHRIVNYDYYQSEQICSIGSGAVESAIKQISRRVKISGAQWNESNVPQVLGHRCAYLNGLICMQR